MTELARLTLAIEPDLQRFAGFILAASSALGGRPFSASLPTLNLIGRLRQAGAGTGYPLAASLELQNGILRVRWENDNIADILAFGAPPDPARVAELQGQLQQSTAFADPEILRRRNEEMMRYLEETKARTEKEIKAMQQTLAEHQLELRESLRQAETDPLTGLLNRRAYDERLEQAFRRTIRQHDEALSLLLLDIDHFKQINDEFGHQFGDAYLNKMAQAMRVSIREGVDLAFRFGGDEFAILLFSGRPIACDKALHILQEMNYKVSIGIASVSSAEPCDGDLQNFIRRADSALYEAKRTCRGRAVVAELGAEGRVKWRQLLPPAQASAA